MVKIRQFDSQDSNQSGFYRVLSVTGDAVDYLSGENQDPTIVIKDREKFVEGLMMLKEVKDRLESSERET